MIIGITGGSGSGKSSVSKALSDKGFYVIDADIVAREIVMPGKKALSEIEEAFGKDVILPDGCLDRKKLGSIVFSDGEKLEHFDMKQMICHLLGIATGVLKGELKQKQIDFIYLLYDPTELNLDSNTKAEVDTIYERTCYECNLIDFATLLRVIFAFLKEDKYGEVITDENLDALICKFTFALASQDFYPVLLQ